jgi:hypothetical protein
MAPSLFYLRLLDGCPPRYQSRFQWLSVCAVLPTNCKRCLIVFCAIQFFLASWMWSPQVPRNIKSLIPKKTPTWGAQRGNESNAKATWLGYVLVQIPLDDTQSSHGLAAMHATSLNSPLRLGRRAASVSFLTLSSRIAALRPSGWGLLASLVRCSHQMQQRDLLYVPDIRFRCAL